MNAILGIQVGALLGIGLLAGRGVLGAHGGAAPHPAAHAQVTRYSHAAVPPIPGPAGQLTIQASGAKSLTLPHGATAPPGMQALSLTVTITNPTGTAITITNQDVLTGTAQNGAAMTAVDQVVLPPAPSLFAGAAGSSAGHHVFRVTVPAHGTVHGNVSAFVPTKGAKPDAVALLVPTPQGLDQVSQALFTP
ncbi:MAG: hypothetical protein ACP5QO_14270 [Clostridia bacterium]